MYLPYGLRDGRCHSIPWYLHVCVIKPNENYISVNSYREHRNLILGFTSCKLVVCVHIYICFRFLSSYIYLIYTLKHTDLLAKEI